MQNDFETTHLKPNHVPVTLSNGTKATVSLSDIEFMILSLLTDETLMKKENMAEGYDIFTGIVDPNHPANQNYGEVHTGDAWEPARFFFAVTNMHTCPFPCSFFVTRHTQTFVDHLP